jgi:ribonuclease E
MSKKILVDALYPGETRVVIYDKNRIQDFDYENGHKKQLKGNIYLARVTRVEPSLQAAFVEYGGDKHGFLPFNDIHPNYFLLDGEGSNEQTGESLANKISTISLTDFQEAEDEKEEILLAEDSESDKNNGDESVENVEVFDEDISEDSLSDEDLSVERQDTLHQKYKIQDVIKKGQLILVQIIKEERGNKGASCTSYISLAGRYCVLMPNSERQGGGISRRIVNLNDRKRLKDVVSTLSLPESVGIILRTAGAGRKASDIRRDYYYLARLWNAIREHAIEEKANSFIHAESDLLKRTIRDLYSSEISEIQIQGTESYKLAKDFMKKLLPLHVSKVKEYKSKTPIFTKYHIEEQIAALYQPVAHLPSGGYIVINPTEALIAIDVNSGKATNERNIEETATKTNIEAAVEIARQLRLRDMSGLIVIDFIDMLEQNNRRLVERSLRDAFQLDRAKVQLGSISAFGLLEMSRQRLQSSFMESNTVICPSCSGKGHIKSFDSNSIIILRTIESEIYKGDCEVINVYAHPDIVFYLLNNRRGEILQLESSYKCKVILHKENTVYYDGFFLEKTLKNEKLIDKKNGPKFVDSGFDSYPEQEILEEAIAEKEEQFGLGKDLAPYQVNDDEAMNETVDVYNRNNRKKFSRNSSNKFNRKRKIAKESNEDDQPTFPTDHNKPALIYQPEDKNKRNSSGKRKSRKFNGNKRDKEAGAITPEKKSALKSWWDRLIE